MVIFLYNLYVFDWVKPFWGPPLNHHNPSPAETEYTQPLQTV